MKKPEKTKTPAFLMVVAFLVLLSLFVGWINRVEYIRYLSREGYGLKDIVVPWGVWWRYKSTGRGLILWLAGIVPWLVIAVGFLLVITRNRRKK
jgi:hypothetical protein